MIDQHYELPKFEECIAAEDYSTAIRVGEMVRLKTDQDHASLSKCYLALGDLSDALRHAYQAGMHTFYLQSMVFRSRGNFELARDILIANPPDSQKIKGLYYLNLGAAFADDPDGDPMTAMEHYLTAFSMLEGKDLIFLKIKMAQAHITLESPEEALSILKNLEAEGSLKVLKNLTQAQAYRFMKQKVIEAAVPLAEKHDLQRDVQRLKQLQE